MTDMSEDRFVRVDIYENGENARCGYAWGIFDQTEDCNFRILYCLSSKVKHEANEDGRIDLYEDEVETAVDAEKVWTPAKAWVALAKCRLLGKVE